MWFRDQENAMAAEIFLSHRRRDADDSFRKLLQRLSQAFGQGSLIYDQDRLAAGQDFVRLIDNAVRVCKVALVVIGRHWADEPNSDGTPKIFDPRDYVREEIS